jgi:hypothetical protein
VLLLKIPIGFLRDPTPYTAKALVVHELSNKSFPETILDLVVTHRLYVSSLFYKNSFCSSDRELSPDVTSIFVLYVIQTIG